MLRSIHDAHDDNHAPKLMIEQPDSFRITDVKIEQKPRYVQPEYTEIYFSYKDDDYMVTDNPDHHSLEENYPFVDDGSTISLFVKRDGEYILLDSVFDSRTRLHYIKSRKQDLLIRLTDIKLLGGCAEQEVELLHKELEELDKRRRELRDRLYP